jgi:isochorismate synthase
MPETYGESQTHATPCAFMLAAQSRPVIANGLLRRLAAGPAETLAVRVREFFADNDDARLLVGALPFDRAADDFLFEPQSVTDLPLNPPATGPRPDRRWKVTPQPSRAEYEQAVSRALDMIAAEKGAADAMEKIVLSRSVLLEAEPPIDLLALSSRLLGDPAAVRFLTPLGQTADGVSRHLIGATPELLISKTGDRVVSHPLAGSARRSDDAEADRAAAEWLLGSEKDRREHRWVVEAILDALAPYCLELSAPEVPALVSTQTMWHLGTRIEGLLKSPNDVSAAELAAALHPTPAVGGTPRGRALELISQLEGYDRGFYAGAVGWTDRAGDGEWYVSLRCAEVAGKQVRIYAGAGIVEGSVPAEEAEETSGKLQAMLRALGVDEQGHSSSAGSCAAEDSRTVAG